LGNTCFTFLSPVDAYSKERNVSILTRALTRLGVRAESSGRNDLLVGGRKVSGSAYKQNQQRAFHHGTLLVDVDTSILGRVLNPSKAKMQSKGVASVVQRVLNGGGERVAVETLNIDTVQHTEPLMHYFKVLGEWEWRYGNNPDFEHLFETRFEWGTLDVHVSVHQSRVTDAQVYSDSLRPAMPKLLAVALRGVVYDCSGIDHAVRRTAYLLGAHANADYLSAPFDVSVALEAADELIDGKTLDQCCDALDSDDRRALNDVRGWLRSSL